MIMPFIIDVQFYKMSHSIHVAWKHIIKVSIIISKK